MGFSSKLKAHRHILTLETLKFISEYLVDGNARQAALRSGIPEGYAGRMGVWLRKHPKVMAAVERELSEKELRLLQKSIEDIEAKMQICKDLLGLQDE